MVVNNYSTYSRRAACGEELNPRCRDMAGAREQTMGKAAIKNYRALGNKGSKAGLCSGGNIKAHGL